MSEVQAVTPCTNSDCPIGCPDSHAVVYEPPGFSCGTFRGPQPTSDQVQQWEATAMRLRAARAGAKPWAWAKLPGIDHNRTFRGVHIRWQMLVDRAWLVSERRMDLAP